MNLRPKRSRTSTAALILASVVLALGSGCENTDWNWDTTWWRKPRRTVRPVRRATTPPAAKPQKDAPKPDPAEPKAPPPKDTATLRQTPTAAEKPAEPATTGRPTHQPAAQPPAATPEAPTHLQQRPYYQLYFLSSASENLDRGQHALKLARASARSCAGVVEMLYVPMGKSGSNQECYLLYEEPDEFQAAAAIGPALDIAPLKEAPTTAGADQAFEAGVGLLLGILESGIVVESTAVSSCERLLAEAVQSKQSRADQRWMAGILAGRLVSEFRFDYPTAESYYRQALQHVEPESIEDMVGRWWLADSLVQQGRTAKAEAVYRAIRRTYEEIWPDSHIVKRSRAWLKSPRS